MTKRELSETVKLTSRKHVFHGLDGLRGVAAVLVSLMHFQAYIIPMKINSGYLAVDMFFLMSGFVISYSYSEKIRSGMGSWDFFISRLIRLYPLYILGIGILVSIRIVALVIGRSQNYTWPHLAFALIPEMLFLPSPPYGKEADVLYELNFPAWSLLSEIAVNIAFACVIKNKLEKYIPAFILLSCSVIIVFILIFGSANAGNTWSTIWAGPIRVCFSFFLGMYIYRIYETGKLPKVSLPILIVLMLSVIVMVFDPGKFRKLYDVFCIVFVFPVMLIILVNNKSSDKFRIFSILGLISYPLYALHAPVVGGFVGTVERLTHRNLSLYSPYFGLLMILLICLFSYTIAIRYDAWLRRLLTNLYTKVRRGRAH